MFINIYFDLEGVNYKISFEDKIYNKEKNSLLNFTINDFFTALKKVQKQNKKRN